MAKNAAYRRAERRIEEALRTQATKPKLDLSVRHGAEDSARLTELPESLTRLTRLEWLNLDGNQLTALPEFLRGCLKTKPLI